MAERIIQYQFDEQFNQMVERDVTPPGFTGLQYPQRWEAHSPSPLGRFVREAPENKQITSPADMAAYLQQHIFNPWEDFPQEELWSFLLDTKNVIRYDAMVYRGTINASYVRISEIFREAIKLNAAALIVSHNHPSGQVEPSPEDIYVTERLVQAGQILDCPILDHLIIGDKNWVSLKEQGLGIWKF